MSFNAKFKYTHSMVKNLAIIEAARAVINVLPLPPDQVLYLRQSARQRATRNSTKIEGNTLNSIEIGQAVIAVLKSPTEMQQEVRNYWRALEWIEEQLETHRSISEDFILELHCILLVRGHGRRGQKSKYRNEECPVVDSVTRQIDYGPPEPKDVPALMRDLVVWLNNSQTMKLPGPIRAGLLAHRFVSIHPFSDGNGRTARALATTELWRSGYDMKGFLSLEEYYTRNISAYYNNLQMGLPVNFYEGRNDPDHTPWLEYFISTMAQGADELHTAAKRLYEQKGKISLPWEEISRVQQQLLMRLTFRLQNNRTANASMVEFKPSDIMDWFCVSSNTAHDWLVKWREEDFVQPAKSVAQRVRSYLLTEKWTKIVELSIDNASIKRS